MQRSVDRPAPAAASARARRRSELLVFLLLAVLVWPVLAVGAVGGYGFAVWMEQQVYGPPHIGGPGHAR